MIQQEIMVMIIGCPPLVVEQGQPVKIRFDR
jgi:hypothetical protein